MAGYKLPLLGAQHCAVNLSCISTRASDHVWILRSVCRVVTRTRSTLTLTLAVTSRLITSASSFGRLL